MAQWKKLVVSGSNISQLVNDSNYVLNGVAGQSVTGSFSGDGSGLTNVSAANITGLDVSRLISGSSIAVIDPIKGFRVNTDTQITGSLKVKDGSVTVAGFVETSNIQGTGSVFIQPDKNDVRKLQIYNTSVTDVHIKSNGGQTFLGDDTNYVKIDDSAQTVTITGANGITLSNDTTFNGHVIANYDLTVGGSLNVQGTITNINTTNLDVEDAFILLNSGSAATGDSGFIFGGSNGAAQAGAGLIWDASYNANDGRLAVVGNMASDATGNQTPAYYVGGVFEGTAGDAETAQADHVGNIRVEGVDIFIYV
jgi:hypothetical protein